MIKAVIINTDNNHMVVTFTEGSTVNPEDAAKEYMRNHLGRFTNYRIEMVDTNGANAEPEVYKRINNGYFPGSFEETGVISEPVRHYG